MTNDLPPSINTSLTNFISEHSETVKTDKTDVVDNNDFLQAIFGKELNGAFPLIVNFLGNPNTVQKSKWFARPWSNDFFFPVEGNNYFSLALFRPDDSGQFRRKKAYFSSLHAVMLDDIGTKVDMERLTLEPTWLLETSPGNFQAGYLLDEPLTDIKEAEQLMNAILKAKLCDPGSNGPCTRLARLPVGVNGKHEPPFSCKPTIWRPERRYSMQELVTGLQLEMAHNEPPSTLKQQRSRASKDNNSDAVCIPCSPENAVIAILRQHNLYKCSLGDGTHEITCPWIEEHTDSVDSGTAYFEPNDNYPIGGLNCLHGHCAERNIYDLLHKFDIDINAARMKSVIRVIAGEIPRIVDAAERELAQSGKHYQRGGLIVEVCSDPSTREIRIQEISKPALLRALADSAIWEKFDGRAKDWVRIDPPERHTGVLFDASNYRYLPFINGLARQPYLRPDGSFMTTEGYDAMTHMFGVFESSKFSVPDKPTHDQAEMALALLQGLLTEFRFANESDKAAALSAILTATIRPSLMLAPMYHVRAHAPGSGKSYLCELITAFATPQKGTPTVFPTDDDECRKLLLAELLRAPAVIEFDNLTSDLMAHKSLCMALTAEYTSGRILGESKTAAVSTRTLFLSSGNNVGPIQDMTRRCITIYLDPMIETPASRTFNCPNLVQELLQERERYVSAALTIIRAWIVAGRPMKSCKSLVSYGEWSDLCRQPLLWLGCVDPTLSVFEALSEDPDREMLARLLDAWHASFGKAPTMVREAINRINQMRDGELREILHDIAEERGEINRRKLGRWIKRNAGRIINGLRFVRSGGNSSAEKWRVESVSQVLSLSTCSTEKTVNSADAYRRASAGE